MNNITIIIVFILLVAAFIWFNENREKWRHWKKPSDNFPTDWRGYS